MKTRSCALGLALLVSIIGCFPALEDDDEGDEDLGDDGTSSSGGSSTEESTGSSGDSQGTGGTTSGGSSGQSTNGSSPNAGRKLGTVVIRVYRPSGACESTRTSNPVAFQGQMHATQYDKFGRESYARAPANPELRYRFPAYKDYTFTNTSRVTWKLTPDASSYPTSCVQEGEVNIAFDGETKHITLWD
mgnify:CR=1 FL=1